MANAPLMPKATAVWLVDNTSLSFAQIADFCHLHELEVKAIADGDAAQGIRGIDPVSGGQLAREEVERAEQDPAYRLKIQESKVKLPEVVSLTLKTTSTSSLLPGTGGVSTSTVSK